MEHSLFKRFSARITANLFILPLNILSQALVPRMLGPVMYGNYSFLVSTFEHFVGFFDSGLSQCLFNKTTQNPSNSQWRYYFWRIFLVLSASSIALTTVAIFSSLRNDIWPDQKNIWIYFGLLFALNQWLVKVLTQLLDAYALTITGEFAKVLQKVVAVLFLVALYYSERNRLEEYFVYQISAGLLLVGMYIFIFERSGRRAFPSRVKNIDSSKNYFSAYIKYSKPIFVYSGVGAIVGILDRWMLQNFAGAHQQSYFGIAFQISAISFLITKSMTQLFGREVAKAHGNGDIEQIRQLFRKLLPTFYTITAYFCIFVSSEAESIGLLFGGEKFVNATPVIALMALCPIHQTYGQLCGSFYFATSQTKAYQNIGVVSLVLGLIAAFFLIAPSELHGLELGSKGLAAKWLGSQLISVNALLFFATRFLKIRFLPFLIHQAVLLAWLYLFAQASSSLVNLTSPLPLLIEFLLKGILYTALAISSILIWPKLVGPLVRRDEILILIRRFYDKLIAILKIRP